MLEFPVWDLFYRIGCLSLWEDGLYWRYSAWVQTQRTGFLRLYIHGADCSSRLGVLSRSGDRFSVAGRISRRALGETESAYVSIQECPWRPLNFPLDGGIKPSGVLFRPMGVNRLLIWERETPITEELLPFFCFLREDIAEGKTCLSMLVDRQGRPTVPGIIR